MWTLVMGMSIALSAKIIYMTENLLRLVRTTGLRKLSMYTSYCIVVKKENVILKTQYVYVWQSEIGVQMKI